MPYKDKYTQEIYSDSESDYDFDYDDYDCESECDIEPGQPVKE